MRGNVVMGIVKQGICERVGHGGYCKTGNL